MTKRLGVGGRIHVISLVIELDALVIILAAGTL
jgi:hypothetical protein